MKGSEEELENLMLAAAQSAYFKYSGKKLSDNEARVILGEVVRCMSEYSKKTGRDYVA